MNDAHAAIVQFNAQSAAVVNTPVHADGAGLSKSFGVIGKEPAVKVACFAAVAVTTDMHLDHHRGCVQRQWASGLGHSSYR
jgi:hypothetical protein